MGIPLFELSRHSWDVRLVPNNSEFCVCLSVWQLAYFLAEIRKRHISSSGWYIFLEFLGDIHVMLVHWFQIITNFVYVCQSGSWNTSLLKSEKFRDISSSGWYMYLSELLWRHSWDVGTLFPNEGKIQMWLSVCWRTPLI